ncbi:UNVERIFIED_CONTAM: hypothetical protein K2H54_032946 [Gekko kuhli]
MDYSEGTLCNMDPVLASAGLEGSSQQKEHFRRYFSEKVFDMRLILKENYDNEVALRRKVSQLKTDVKAWQTEVQNDKGADTAVKADVAPVEGQLVDPVQQLCTLMTQLLGQNGQQMNMMQQHLIGKDGQS